MDGGGGEGKKERKKGLKDKKNNQRKSKKKKKKKKREKKPRTGFEPIMSYLVDLCLHHWTMVLVGSPLHLIYFSPGRV